jgi:hypothetical protein
MVVDLLFGIQGHYIISITTVNNNNNNKFNFIHICTNIFTIK